MTFEVTFHCNVSHFYFQYIHTLPRFVMTLIFLSEPHWSEVLTEILLSFLAQSSHMMRQIVNMVFSIILPHITHTAFQLIKEVCIPFYIDRHFYIFSFKSSYPQCLNTIIELLKWKLFRRLFPFASSLIYSFILSILTIRCELLNKFIY